MGEEEKSTAATEQQDECEDYAVDVTTASSWYKNVSYDDAKIFIRTNIESAARSRKSSQKSYLPMVHRKEFIRKEACWLNRTVKEGIIAFLAQRWIVIFVEKSVNAGMHRVGIHFLARLLWMEIWIY